MADQLLVRMYNVGLGDFIYLRVPDRRRKVHIVIDCGNKFGSSETLEKRWEDLKKDLPTVRGKKQLDLLVVTHPHEDHHKGFEPALFEDVRIARIWLSPAFNRADPNAQAFHALQDAAFRALSALAADAAQFEPLASPAAQLAPASALDPGSSPPAELSDIEDLSLDSALPQMVGELMALNRDEAIAALCHTLPEKNGIEPLFVSADTPPEKLKIFRDPRIQLKVIGPMGNIDAYYLGGAGLNALVEPALQVSPQPPGALAAFGGPLEAAAFSPDAAAYAALFPLVGRQEGHAPNPSPLANGWVGEPGGSEDGASAFGPAAMAPQPGWPPAANIPSNISTQDFKRLQGRVRPSALAAAEIAGHAVNNLSVVLLLEWRGRRLLFPGDAEWRDAAQIEIKPGRSNGSWNVMWHERREELSQPLDFLKIGHHGSENATPWRAGHPIAVILDALLPVPAPGKAPAARAVASTQRTRRWPSIPDPALLAELGRRVANTRREYVEPQKGIHVPPGIAQPQRTDLEFQATGNEMDSIELLFSEE